MAIDVSAEEERITEAVKSTTTVATTIDAEDAFHQDQSRKRKTCDFAANRKIHEIPLFSVHNNVHHVPFVSKMARLNSECSDSALQANCVVGQKWRCIREDGQWRKHKCKFDVSEHLCEKKSTKVLID